MRFSSTATEGPLSAIMSSKPARRRTSAVPWIVSAKIEFLMLGTMRPTTFDRFEAKFPASRFGT
jgi:hypothetical protein